MVKLALNARSRILRGTTLALAGLLLPTACAKKAAGPHGPPPPTDVSYTVVTPATLPVDYEFIGQTDASQSVEIRARVQGFLLDWRKNFTEGTRVQKGQILFQIDPSEFELALAEAEASLQRAEARLERANREVRRLRQAVATSAAAERELDDAVTEQLQAQADVRSQKSLVEGRKLDVSYTTIRSPLDGVIGRARRDVGSLVDDNQNSLLATVDQLNPIYAYFSFSERDYINFQQDVEAGRVLLPRDGSLFVEITLIDGTDYPYAGVINFSDVRIDPQTGSARVRAQFNNPPVETVQGSEFFLRPGQFVKAKIVGWVRPDTVAVPQQAVVQGATGAYVYVVGAESKAEVRPVTTGQWMGSDWIIRSGLVAGDKVITEGVSKVLPNVPVNASAATPTTLPTTRQARPTSGPATGPMTRPDALPRAATTLPAASD